MLKNFNSYKVVKDHKYYNLSRYSIAKKISSIFNWFSILVDDCCWYRSYFYVLYG